MKSFFAAGQPRGTKTPSWHKTNKELTSFSLVSSHSVSFVSTAWHFCTRWLTNCKRPIWKWHYKLGFQIRSRLSDFVIGQKNLVIIAGSSCERVDLKAGFYFTPLRIRYECWQKLTSFQGKSPGEKAALPNNWMFSRSRNRGRFSLTASLLLFKQSSCVTKCRNEGRDHGNQWLYLVNVASCSWTTI